MLFAHFTPAAAMVIKIIASLNAPAATKLSWHTVFALHTASLNKNLCGPIVLRPV